MSCQRELSHRKPVGRSPPTTASGCQISEVVEVPPVVLPPFGFSESESEDMDGLGESEDDPVAPPPPPEAVAADEEEVAGGTPILDSTSIRCTSTTSQSSSSSLNSSSSINLVQVAKARFLLSWVQTRGFASVRNV